MSLEITCTRNEADHKQILRCKNTIDKSSSSFQTMSKILTLAGNEVRLKILSYIFQGIKQSKIAV